MCIKSSIFFFTNEFYFIKFQGKMPGAVLESPKLTKTMYQALKKHIMKEREKKKQGIVTPR